MIECTSDLIDYWDECNECGWPENIKYPPGPVPLLLREILEAMGDVQLGVGKLHYTSLFKFWGTINRMLQRFGRLYQPIEEIHKFQVDPGTTFVAGGNEVHAGPPTVSPRMFAFAIGIPEEDEEARSDKSKNKRSDGSGNESEGEEDEENNGEVQYFPVLFHLDFCSIIFGMMEHEYEDRRNEYYESKMFLLWILIQLICEYPSESYEQSLSNTGRGELQMWLGRLRTALNDCMNVDDILNEAACDGSVVFRRKLEKRARKSKRAMR